MTREEALSKAIMTLIYFQAHFCKSKEAVDNTQAIIDTLEQIEQEPCAVKERTETHACVCIIDKLKAKSYSESEYGVPEFDSNKVIQLSDAIEIAQSFIEDVEAVKDLLPQPKIGRWMPITVKDDDCDCWGRIDSHMEFKCSNCHKVSKIRSKYCPECGEKKKKQPLNSLEH